MAKQNFKKEIVKRRKSEPVTFRKHFATFEEAINALRKTDKAINDIFMDTVEEGEEVAETVAITDPKQAIEYVTKDFNNFLPDLMGNENIYLALNISANKVTYRVDKELAFGWLISYDVQNGHAVINDVSAQITVYNTDSLKGFMLELTGDNWEQVPSRK